MLNQLHGEATEATCQEKTKTKKSNKTKEDKNGVHEMNSEDERPDENLVILANKKLGQGFRMILWPSD